MPAAVAFRFNVEYPHLYADEKNCPDEKSRQVSTCNWLCMISILSDCPCMLTISAS
jgi:hypothetical protein